jgi:enoyl-CoA hydratase/carnithine racemase
VRQTLRGHLADEVRQATAHELDEQNWLLKTADAREGVRAVAERRTGRFTGQ